MYEKMISELNTELDQIRNVRSEELFDFYRKYVDNTEELKKMIDRGFFRFEYIRVNHVFKDTIFEDGMEKLISCMRLALKSEKDKCLPLLNDFSINVSRGCTSLSQMNMLRSAHRPARLDLFAKEVLHEVAEVVENTLQPYIVMYYQLRRIIEGKEINKRVKLGSIIRELIDEDEVFRVLYCNLTMDVNIAKWRNAYDHGDYYVKDDRIIVSFGEDERSIDKKELSYLLGVVDMLVFMHKVSYMLFMVDYGHFVDRGRLREKKGVDSTTDNIVMHIAEVSANYNCKLEYFLQDEHLVILSMMGGVVPHDQMEKLLQVVFAITEYTYDIIVYYDSKVRYAAQKAENGMECQVFGIPE